MEIKRYELLQMLKKSKFLGTGGGGTAYYNPKINKVIKIFHSFSEPSLYESYKKEDILRFNNIQTKIFIFPIEVVVINDIVIGYICDYVKGNTLQNIDLLNLNLKKFVCFVNESLPDIKKVSDYKIALYDIAYNIMFGEDGLFIIDTDDYFFSSKDNLDKLNDSIFSDSIKTFLVDNYFDEFVNSNKLLKELYFAKDAKINDFLDLFSEKLSEYTGSDITTLIEAVPALNKKYYEPKFIRNRVR
ncbi:MAG: hypothetical protein ACI4XR_00235 [Bacilli bacterium]